jgi:hypothetical protein
VITPEPGRTPDSVLQCVNRSPPASKGYILRTLGINFGARPITFDSAQKIFLPPDRSQPNRLFLKNIFPNRLQSVVTVQYRLVERWRFCALSCDDVKIRSRVYDREMDYVKWVLRLCILPLAGAWAFGYSVETGPGLVFVDERSLFQPLFNLSGKCECGDLVWKCIFQNTNTNKKVRHVDSCSRCFLFESASHSTC